MTPPVLVQLGPLGLTETVFVSAALTGVLLVLGLVGARVARAREVAEVIYEFVESMLQDMVTVDVAPVVPLVLTQWLFILSANLVGLLPVVSSPTRDLSLTAALAVVAFGAGHVYGFQAQGWRYLKHYIEPNPIMLPFNVIGEASRTVALALRLFGNMVSGEIVAAIVVSLAGLLLPVPLMLLDVLTSVVQAYIFGVLTLVFTASAMQVAGRAAAPPPPPDGAPS
ncbi:MAG: F0F1 ATP synthase subunit A [Alphaproteobacteria bacterium]|nr:F0F1 ATP synthase subunit A [Alphaproteobacteria bacterium]MCB9791116.1 F0F1 ATP synthase subunit A [Alphaproteobacteria bacterium]